MSNETHFERTWSEKLIAGTGKIVYYECGAIGQYSIVNGSPKGNEYFDPFRTSRLGTLFVEGKYVNNCVDHSDSATYWVLLGEYGVSLKDIAPDGTNSASIEKANESKFAATSRQIHDELLRRSKFAAVPIAKIPVQAIQAIKNLTIRGIAVDGNYNMALLTWVNGQRGVRNIPSRH